MRTEKERRPRLGSPFLLVYNCSGVRADVGDTAHLAAEDALPGGKHIGLRVPLSGTFAHAETDGQRIGADDGRGADGRDQHDVELEVAGMVDDRDLCVFRQAGQDVRRGRFEVGVIGAVVREGEAVGITNGLQLLCVGEGVVNFARGGPFSKSSFQLL